MATKRENPYALGLHQLAFAFQRFLAEVKSFFTQKVNLQRQGAAISASTYAKVQKRILCNFISLYSLTFLQKNFNSPAFHVKWHDRWEIIWQMLSGLGCLQIPMDQKVKCNMLWMVEHSFIGSYGHKDFPHIGRSVTCIASMWCGSTVLQLSSLMVTTTVPQKIGRTRSKLDGKPPQSLYFLMT